MEWCKTIKGENQIKSWLQKIEYVDDHEYPLRFSAIKGGNIEVLNWLYDINADMFTQDDYSYDLAASFGHIHVMNWLKNLNLIPDMYECAKEAIRTKNLNALQWLKENFYVNWQLEFLQGTQLWYMQCKLVYLLDYCMSKGDFKSFFWLMEGQAVDVEIKQVAYLYFISQIIIRKPYCHDVEGIDCIEKYLNTKKDEI